MFSQQTTKIVSRRLSPAKLHYNCALFQLNKEQHLIYRCQNSLTKASWLAVSRLGEGLDVLDHRRLETGTLCAEDPRVTVLGNEVYVFFNSGCLTYPKIQPDDMTIFVAVYDNEFNLKRTQPLTYAGRQQCEKNWQMFYDADARKWFCIYSVNPWRVLEFNDQWEGTLVHEEQCNVPWLWGTIRGGSNPIRIVPPAGVFTRGPTPDTQYWSWFHSSYQHPVRSLDLARQYVGGLLTFSSRFPFLPIGISRFPIIAPKIGDRTVVGADVVFPAGAVHQDGSWLVSYGSGDCQCKVDRLDHAEVTCGLNFEGISRPKIEQSREKQIQDVTCHI